MRILNFFRKAITFPYGNRLKSGIERRKASQNTLKFWKEILNVNQITFKEITEIYTITAGDYTNDFFEEIRQSIKNQNVINREFQKQFTWNKPHLHFELIVTDNKKKYIGAIIYPYEYFDNSKLLWLHEIEDSINKSYLQELISHQSYPIK